MDKEMINPFDWDFSNNGIEEITPSEGDGGSGGGGGSSSGGVTEETVQNIVEQKLDTISLQGEDLTYSLFVNGNNVGTINIPEDQFLKNVEYDAENKEIVFTMNTDDGEKNVNVSIADIITSVEEDIENIELQLDNFETKENVSAIAQRVTVLENGMSAYATQSWVQEQQYLTQHQDISNLATKQEVNEVDEKVDNLEIPSIEGLASQQWVEEQGFLTEHQDISGKANVGDSYTKEESDEKYAIANELAVVATSGDYSDLKNTPLIPSIEGLANADDVTEEIAAAVEPLATKTELQSVNAKLDAIVIPDVSEFAEKSDVTEEISSAVDILNQTLAEKANIDDVYSKEESDELFQISGNYVSAKDYNELVKKFSLLENYINIFIKDRETKMDELINNMDADNKEVIIETPMETIDVPETTNAYTITAPLADNSIVTLASPKYMTLINTSEEPVSTSICHTYVEGETTSATSVYLVGDFDTLTLENISPAVKSGYDAATVNNVVISENNVKNLTLALDIQDGATITNNSNANITIQDKNNTATTLTIVAPNSTVTLNGSTYEVLNATVGADTLIIKKNVVHIDELNVSKGNVIVEVPRQSLIAEKIGDYTIADGYTIDYLHDEINSTNVANLAKEGTHTLVEDVARSGNFSVSVLSSDDIIWELNGHSITSSNTRGYGIFRLRGSAHLEINDSVGTGIVKNTDDDYGLWTGTVDSKIVINGGNFEAATHVLYTEKGTIEVNGGTFKLTNWETADKDASGNLKFLINCHDADYVSGAAKIIVRGGKFYDFDPANCAAEGVGTSFVAEGYGSVMTTEIIDGVEHRVYEVKPINE